MSNESGIELWTDKPLKGKGAVVIGAAGGVGFGIASELATAGARVLLADLEKDALASSAGELQSPFVAVDLRDPASIDALSRSAAAELGAVDVLVNSAGVLSVAPVVDLSVADWDRVMAINSRGVFLSCKAFLPHMIERGQGSIVNIASINAKRADASLAHYSASKFAVVGFTQALAKEVAADGVRVNAVCPGLVHTKMIDDLLAGTGRSVQDELAAQLIRTPQAPREIGAAVVFLALMPSITGQAVNVDGGTVFA